MNKIIGFFITRNDFSVHFPFKNNFDWIRIEKHRINTWTVYLWGHGCFDAFIDKGTETKIIVGYSENEVKFLGTDILRNRGALLRIGPGNIRVENDPIGAMRVFYGQSNNVPHISTVEELVLQGTHNRKMDRTNLVQYLLIGHLTGSQTLYSHVHTLEANQRLIWNNDRFHLEDLPALEYTTSGNPVETLYKVTKNTIERYSAGYDRLFLPLSGGYDSRMLAGNVSDASRLCARTYGYSYPLSQAYEVTRAEVVARTLGISDWQYVDLGFDYIADQSQKWFDIFGTSHHLHGMYHLHFYQLIKEQIGKCLPTLSGYVGDAVVGHQISDFEAVANADAVSKFIKAQYQGPVGFTPDELRRLLNWNINECFQDIHHRWEGQWNTVNGKPYQKFILTLLRERGRSHVSYLCTVADLFGGIITPFIDRDYLSTVIGLPFDALNKRAAQEAVFKKFFPNLWLNESKFPPYSHYLNFLAIKKRRWDNIFPIVTEKGTAAHEWVDQEVLINDILKPFERICDHDGLVQNQYAIRPLYLCNVLQPIYYSKLTEHTDQLHSTLTTYPESKAGRMAIKPDALSIDIGHPNGLDDVHDGLLTASSSQGRSFSKLSLDDHHPKSHYDKSYFDWQKSIGAFGGIANQFKFKTYIHPECTLVDFGCGGGYLLKNLSAKCKVGIEVNEKARIEALRNGIFAVEKTELIPDSFADVVISNHALEHVGNPLRDLKVIRRKLKSRGIAIFVVPHQGPDEKYCEEDVNNHLYTWNPQTLGNLFRTAGFGVIDVGIIQHQWPPNYRQVFEEQGEEAFHRICRIYAEENDNYQIRVIASRELHQPNDLAA